MSEYTMYSYPEAEDLKQFKKMLEAALDRHELQKNMMPDTRDYLEAITGEEA
jgi:hypothetical protein